MKPIQTILFPTDFSESAEFAYHLASSLARDHQARLVILHVANAPAFSVGEVPIPPPNTAEFREDLLKQLNAIQPLHLEVKPETLLLEGDPVNCILKAADDLSAGLIVMGTHGRTGLNRMLMGSVAEQVVRKAACPVLTVKTPTAEDNLKRKHKKMEAFR